ncbi:MAG: hypothetical protein AAF355_14665 [Myxococcota bacterium]
MKLSPDARVAVFMFKEMVTERRSPNVPSHCTIKFVSVLDGRCLARNSILQSPLADFDFSACGAYLLGISNSGTQLYAWDFSTAKTSGYTLPTPTVYPLDDLPRANPSRQDRRGSQDGAFFHTMKEEKATRVFIGTSERLIIGSFNPNIDKLCVEATAFSQTHSLLLRNSNVGGHTIPDSRSLTSMAVRPDGNRVALGFSCGSLIEMDLTTKQCESLIDVPSADGLSPTSYLPLRLIAYSADSRTLVAIRNTSSNVNEGFRTTVLTSRRLMWKDSEPFSFDLQALGFSSIAFSSENSGLLALGTDGGRIDFLHRSSADITTKTFPADKSMYFKKSAVIIDLFFCVIDKCEFLVACDAIGNVCRWLIGTRRLTPPTSTEKPPPPSGAPPPREATPCAFWPFSG